MSVSRLVLACVLVSGLLVSITADPVGAAAESPRIEIVAPNPVSDGNRGEYVVLSCPEPTDLDGWTVTDGTHTAALPNRTIEGRVAFGGAPSVTELLTPTPAYAWDGHLPLSAEGDELALIDPGGTVIDTVAYPRTRNGERWVRSDGSLEREMKGRTDLRFDENHGGVARVFLLPDAPEVPNAALESADERLLVAGYEFTDPEVRDVVLARHAAGVDVRVLVDGQPIGGQTAKEVAVLDTFVEAGIPVRVLTGARDRFRFHHPKYAVIDDSALVMTENWKPAGTGGASSRGWGVIVSDPAVADDLATVFWADFGWRDTVAWERHRAGVTGRDVEPAAGHYDGAHAPEEMPIESAKVVVAPEHAERVVTRELTDAAESIDVQQVRISDPEFPPMQALLDAARDGVRVRVLLDSTWYVADENEALVEAIEAEELPIEVRLVEPGDRFGKIHTKGIVIDEETVIVGSMNWNNVSMRDNREVILVLEGEAVGAYYAESFASDWSPPGVRIPLGLVGVVVMAWLGATAIGARRIQFDG